MMNRCREILDHWEDGSITAAEMDELRELLKDPENRKLLLDDFFSTSAIIEVLKEENIEALPELKDAATPVENAVSAAEESRSPWFRYSLTALAASLVITAGAWFFFNLQLQPGIATLVSTDTGVTAIRGSRTIRATPAMDIRNGDALVVPMNAEAIVRFKDDLTTVKALGGTKVSFAYGETGKKVNLQAGILECDVSRQPAGKAMVLTTPHAEADILGTILTISAEHDRTKLEVNQGTVRIRRLSDNKSVEVAAGQAAVACTNLDLVAVENPNAQIPLGSPDFHPSPERPVGWRGDRTGRYPGAKIPLTWQRTPTGPLSDLRCLARKPANNARAEGQPVEAFTIAYPDPRFRLGKYANLPGTRGGINDWLVIGPFSTKNPSTNVLNNQQAPDEASMEPDEGARAGKLSWRRGWFNEIKWTEADQVAYAHTYLYCETPGTMEAACVHDKGLKIWLNGKEVFSSPDTYMDGYARWVRHSARLSMQKGWNRLLLKLSRGAARSVADFWLQPGDVGYDVKNILWTAKLPQHLDFNRNASCPVVADDKVFVISDCGDLICFNRKNGRILWIRSNNYYAVMGDKERRDLNSAQKAKLESLKEPAGRLRALNEEIIADLNAAVSPAGMEPGEGRKNVTSIENKIAKKTELDDLMYNTMEDVDRAKYARRYQTFGRCVQTPCTDGQRIYAWMSTGVAVCYDFDGNLLWSDINNSHPGDNGRHGDYASPLLAAGKLIVYETGNGTAYDCRTGNIIWRNKGGRGGNVYAGPVAAKIGGEDVFFCWTVDIGAGKNQALYRVSDGELLWQDHLPGISEAHGTCGTPVPVGRTFYNFEETGAFGVRLPEKTDAAPALAMHVGTPPRALPCSSPIYHDGLLYCADYWGVLRTYDIITQKMVFEVEPDYYPRDGASVWISCSASPVLAGKHLYFFDNSGTTVVVEPSRAFRQAARNRIVHFVRGDTMEQFVASPAVDGGNMFLRGTENLYCIGTTE